MDLAQHTARLLAETREEAARADTKAEVLTAAYGIVIGATLAGVASGDWGPNHLSSFWEGAFWFGTALVTIACLTLGYTLWPRTRHGKADGQASYYGHVRDYRGDQDRQALLAALTSAAANSQRDIEQLEVMSDIVWRKFVGIQVAMIMFALGAAVCATAAIAG